MKRHGHLWQRMSSFEHLLRAAETARRGKRFRPTVADFEFNLESELWKLHAELKSRGYRPGAYRSFLILEPKERLISAAPYGDRIVHHALTAALEPIFEPAFVFDSYACRRGKGTHAAVRRCQEFARRYPFVLKADIRKFFPSIDHEILKQRIARKIKDPDVQWLAGRIIDHGSLPDPAHDWFPTDDLFTPSERRRGIPIGNQTSQFFANVYLDPLDHFVKERLRIKGYVRYVDDFLLFADDKRTLARATRHRGVLDDSSAAVASAKECCFSGEMRNSFPWLPSVSGISAAGKGKRVAFPAARASDAARVSRLANRLRRNPAAADELVGARRPGRQLSPTGVPVC